jgi:hypothetical protein
MEGIAVPARAALIALLTVVGLAASPAGARSDASTSDASGGPAATASAGRAVVIGTYAVLPTGRVHVSLASDAARVKLTYRNTDGRSRWRVVPIRGGKAAATLASGSRNLKARALATSRLRASGTVRLRRNPVLQDVDANGIRESHYDLDTDGSYETVLFDDNSNGRFEMVFFDTSAGSVLFKDQNEDGYFELTALDVDRNSQLERLFYDGDGDGYAELECLDSIGPDGLADTWVDTRVTTGDAQDRAANDLMVQNIVALNQLRQLDPWSTAYIPYDPAPSLLR